MGPTFQVTFDCADPRRLMAFWSEALGYHVPAPPDGHESWDAWLAANGVPEDQWNSKGAIEDPDGVRPRIFFQRVPEPKAAKNRVHLDVNVGGGREVSSEERVARVRADVARLEALGATKVREAEQLGDFWIVMLDPEGNEFCLQ
jgi:catechol 2,3-dioxygenase-like lactoylglutathione lyase family enzyme